MVDLCRSEHRIIWLSILLGYKGILLIVGVFLAFETRNVKIRHLKDSKLIGMSVYGILVLSLALTAVSLLLEEHVDTFYAVIGIMVMMGSTSLLALIFVPKVKLRHLISPTSTSLAGQTLDLHIHSKCICITSPLHSAYADDVMIHLCCM